MHRLQGQWYLGEMLLAAVRFQGWWRVLDGHQQYLHGRQLGKWGMAMCQLQNGDPKGPDVSQAVVSDRHSYNVRSANEAAQEYASGLASDPKQLFGKHQLKQHFILSSAKTKRAQTIWPCMLKLYMQGVRG